MSEKAREKIKYEDPVEFSIEVALEMIESLLEEDYILSKRAMGLLLLQEDNDIEAIVGEKEPEKLLKIKDVVSNAKKHYTHPLDYIITMRRQQEVNEITKRVTEPIERQRISLQERLSQITMHPVSGIPILLLVLYWGLYKFVGEFGAGTVVDFLEGVVFEQYINPFMEKAFAAIFPWQVVQELFVGEYGVITLGLR
jgi:ferrous iron transport protein B